MEIIVNAKHIKHKLITNIGHKKKGILGLRIFSVGVVWSMCLCHVDMTAVCGGLNVWMSVVSGGVGGGGGKG